MSPDVPRIGLVLAIGIAPGIFWLWMFTRNRRHRPRPARLLIFTFLAGGLVTAPAAGIEWLFLRDESEDTLATISTLAIAMFAVVGPVEETLKFAAVRFGVFRSRYFEEPVDGLIYAAAAGLGFASVENVFYALQFGPEIMIVRGPISTLAHVVFASIWGLALSRSATGPGHDLRVTACCWPRRIAARGV